MFLKQIYRLFLVAALVTIGMTGMGNAANLSYDFTIQYLQGPATNPYGLGLGDTVTVDVTFDKDQGHQEGDLSSHSLLDDVGPFGENTYDSTFALSLSFGSPEVSFDETNDVDYPSFPIVTFNTLGSADPAYWTFNLIDFLVNDDEKDSWIYISVPRTNGPIVFNAGSLADSDNVWSASSVPEPATIALFSIGLLGLAGISRRSK